MKIYLKTLIMLPIIGILIPSFTIAGPKNGIRPEMLRKFQQQLDLDGQDRAIMNAVTGTDLKQLTLNREITNKHNDVFSFKIKTEGITNQKSTGRCWMFAGFNIMRPYVIKKYNLSSFEFSQNYLFFYDKLEKANTFLENMITTADKDLSDRLVQKFLDSPVADGGWWNYFTALVDKYGAVPKEIMDETVNSEKSRNMNYVLDNLLRADALTLRKMVQDGAKPKEIQAQKETMLADVYRLLVYQLGMPPMEFVWRYSDKDNEVIEKKYTPQEFYKEVVGFDLSEHVMIMDHALHPYNQFYEIIYSRNVFEEGDMQFINLDIATSRLPLFWTAYRSGLLPMSDTIWNARKASWR